MKLLIISFSINAILVHECSTVYASTLKDRILQLRNGNEYQRHCLFTCINITSQSKVFAAVSIVAGKRCV